MMSQCGVFKMSEYAKMKQNAIENASTSSVHQASSSTFQDENHTKWWRTTTVSSRVSEVIVTTQVQCIVRNLNFYLETWFYLENLPLRIRSILFLSSLLQWILLYRNYWNWWRHWKKV